MEEGESAALRMHAKRWLISSQRREQAEVEEEQQDARKLYF